MATDILGFDIGGTKCAVIRGRLDGGKLVVLSKKVIKTDTSKSPYAQIDELCSLADAAGAERIGVSCGGPLDSVKGIIQSPPNLPGWDDVRICEILTKRFGIPCSLKNDANACAVAERNFGAGNGADNMIFLTFGTGLGAGVIMNGKLCEGACGMAGEAGHIRLAAAGELGYGKKGSFEGFCSGAGIARMAETAAKKAAAKGIRPLYADTYPVTAKSVAEAAEAGDETALSVYKKCGKYLGKGLSVLIDLLNPEVIVLGGIFARSGELLIPAMRDELEREALPASLSVCRIVPSELGESIGDYGALTAALI